MGKKKRKIIRGVDEEGRPFTSISVDIDELRESRERVLNRAAERLGLVGLYNLRDTLNAILENEPTVSQYKEVATRLSTLLQTYYEQIGKPKKGDPGNVFWTPIRQIDPEDRGRAHSFMPAIRSLKRTVDELIELKKKRS